MDKTVHRPSTEDILAYIRENPHHATKRDIAKAFNIKGDARIWLKNLLRHLINEGKIADFSKRHSKNTLLPPVGLLDIFGRDGDGELLARPVLHRGTQKAQNVKPASDTSSDLPLVTIRPSRHKTGLMVKSGGAIGVGDRVLAKIFAAKDAKGIHYHARIIRKIEKQKQTALGILRRSGKDEWRLQPVLRRQHELRILPHALGAAQEGDLVEVNVEDDLGRHEFGLRTGRLHQIIGHLDSEKSLSMIALYAHSIPHVFPQSVLDEAAAIQPVIEKNRGCHKREDWRQTDFVTIDPVDAKDYDDAVFAFADPDPDNAGGHVVMVAIADVSAYIASDSEIDKEAARRGNSVYFPDHVVPMLPERISNDLCSLREGEDRPALAVRMIFDNKGNQRSAHFYRIMMRSRARLTYEEVQKALDGMPSDKTAPVLDCVLKPLFAAYQALKRARDRRAPLDLDLPDRKILLDETGLVRDVVMPPRLDAHRMIEEMMIAANVAAAETLLKANQPLIYRIHARPPLSKQENLRSFLHSIGLPLARSGELTSKRLNRILAQSVDRNEQPLINQMVLRSQAQAEYSPENIGHFGLALQHYAHFTSPIRRYADLIVHRALIKVLKLGADGLVSKQETQLSEIASAISMAERRAQAAERETVDRLIAHYLEDKAGAQFSARISGVTKAGLFVTLDTLGADGFIPLSTLRQDYYHFDESLHTLTGARSGLGYQLADPVDVRLVEITPLAGSLRFEMLSDPHPLPASTLLSYHKSIRGSSKTSSRKPPRRRR